MAQTLEQRRRNAKFVKDQEQRRGKSDVAVQKLAKPNQKSPVSPMWLILLAFVVFGGLIFEIIQRVFFR